MVQLNYDDQGGVSTKAIEGLLADSGPHNIQTRRPTAAAGIPFGFGVIRGAAYGDIIVPAATFDAVADFEGITIWKAKVDPNTSGNPSTNWLQNEAAGVLTRGRIWVVAEQAIVAGDPVFLRHSGEVGNEAPGRFRKDADTAGAEAIPQARWLDAVAIDQFARIELSTP